MVATNLKAEALKMMDQRTAMEAEMDAIVARLCQPGGPGISGNLLNFDEFPRPDIDIPAVRAERQRLAVLRNDYKDITRKIDEAIQLLHSVRLAPKSSSVKDSGNDSNVQDSSIVNAVASTSPNTSLPRETSTAMDVDAVASIPFAVVDEIADASPAAEDGFQLGDQIVKFGNVESGDDLLPRLASEAQTNQGCAIPVKAVRQGALINLTVTPRTWQGRGLLGCHFRIL